MNWLSWKTKGSSCRSANDSITHHVYQLDYSVTVKDCAKNDAIHFPTDTLLTLLPSSLSSAVFIIVENMELFKQNKKHNSNFKLWGCNVFASLIYN
jgi:hypothetical protein